jgi:hypothetical protein
MFKDLVSIIESYKPTDVVYPHPNDRHPDHWGVNAFVKYTMRCMNYKPEHEWLYLVHRGDWPTPLERNRNIFLVPPMSLLNTGTKWMALDMTPADIEYKSETFKKYRSQIKRIGRLMSAFERKNELFGEYSNIVLVENKRKDSEITATLDNLAIKDPSQDALELEVDTASDLLELHTESSMEGNLHIFILLDKKPDRITNYRLNMVFFKAGTASPMSLVIKGNSLKTLLQRETSVYGPDGISLKVENRNLHIIIPKNKTGGFDSIFLNAETYVSTYYMDRTAWRMIDNAGVNNLQ